MRPTSLFALLFTLFTFITPLSAADSPAPYSEFRLYQVVPGKLEAVLERFRDKIEPLYKKHQIRALGYWTNVLTPEKPIFLYLLSDSSQESLASKMKAFAEDPEFKKAYAESTQKHGPTVEKIETFKVNPLDLPAEAAPNSIQMSRTFEFRHYIVTPGRMNDYIQNYKEHRTALFSKHGLSNYGYWQSADPGQPDSFFMMLTHTSVDAINKAKAAYHADPAWNEAVKPLDKAGPPTKSVVSIMLKAVDFSPVK
ncbi:MAG: NIPSNAP family protein [Verrucomicrobiota bacterium]|nr:NIPSNAP family protein [Verrucomicrobiota bacterium]